MNKDIQDWKIIPYKGGAMAIGLTQYRLLNSAIQEGREGVLIDGVYIAVKNIAKVEPDWEADKERKRLEWEQKANRLISSPKDERNPLKTETVDKWRKLLRDKGMSV